MSLPLPTLPSFAVIGQPNEGKTTLIATLLEDDRAHISPIPGTTMEATRYPVRIDGKEIFVFWDTPGFENPAELLAWFQAQPKNQDEPLSRRFISLHATDLRFRPECEIFKPLADGVAAVYVVDGSRRIRAVDRQEIELLRGCGNPRAVIINSKVGNDQYLQEWHQFLSRDFPTVIEFNALRAGFEQRISLLESIRAVVPEWDAAMEMGISALRRHWLERVEGAAEEVLRLLEDVASSRVRIRLADPQEFAQARVRAQEQLQKEIEERENEFRTELRQYFRHNEDRWVMAEALSADLFSEVVWKFYGLTRRELVLSGAAVGVVGGGTIGLAMGGAPVMTGALIGGTVGAAGAWFGSSRSISIKVQDARKGAARKPGGAARPQQVSARIDPKSNFPWVLLDRAVAYTRAVMGRAHGRRDTEKESVKLADLKQGITSSWNRETRGLLASLLEEWSRDPARRRAERIESARSALREELIVALQTPRRQLLERQAVASQPGIVKGDRGTSIQAEKLADGAEIAEANKLEEGAKV